MIEYPEQPHRDAGFPALITSTGPDGAAEPSDNTFWCKEQRCGNAGTGNRVQLEAHTQPRWVLAEDVNSSSTTHDSSLIGKYVWLYPTLDRSGEDRSLYYFLVRSSTIPSLQPLYDNVSISTGSPVGGQASIIRDATQAITGESRFLCRFAQAVKGRDLYGWQLGNGYASWAVIYAQDLSAGTVIGVLKPCLITEDFDTGTVTWANQPAVMAESYWEKRYDALDRAYVRKSHIEGVWQDSFRSTMADVDFYGIEWQMDVEANGYWVGHVRFCKLYEPYTDVAVMSSASL